MKIILRGIDKATLPTQTICSACNSVFEWARSEGEFVCDQRDGDFYWVNCPVCDHKCGVAARLVRR